MSLSLFIFLNQAYLVVCINTCTRRHEVWYQLNPSICSSPHSLSVRAASSHSTALKPASRKTLLERSLLQTHTTSSTHADTPTQTYTHTRAPSHTNTRERPACSYRRRALTRLSLILKRAGLHARACMSNISRCVSHLKRARIITPKNLKVSLHLPPSLYITLSVKIKKKSLRAAAIQHRKIFLKIVIKTFTWL